MIVGIGSGLAAAFSQSLAYLGTRHFARGRGPWAGRQLLVVGHMWMGVFGVVLLALMWPAGQGLGWAWPARWSLGRMVVFFLLGQAGAMLALHHMEPSRMSPLMGLKTVCNALLATVLPQKALTATTTAAGLTWMQWLSVALATVAAVGLNFAGAQLRKRALAAIVMACAAYAVSDWNIQRTNEVLAAELPGMSAMRISFLSAGLSFFLVGLVVSVAAPWWGARKGEARRDWVDALPFAVTWFAAMLFLFWSFAEVGTVLGAILQSTRGLMSIVIGSLVMYWGHHHLEPASSRGVVAQRLVAGVLMFIAVGLYVLKEPGNIRIGAWHASFEGLPWQAQSTLPPPLPANAGTSC